MSEIIQSVEKLGGGTWQLLDSHSFTGTNTTADEYTNKTVSIDYSQYTEFALMLYENSNSSSYEKWAENSVRTDSDPKLLDTSLSAVWLQSWHLYWFGNVIFNPKTKKITRFQCGCNSTSFSHSGHTISIYLYAR